MTGPLAQQFAQVREGLGDGCAFACGCEDPGNPQRCIHADRFAALSSIERHVQDMEKALRDVARVSGDALQDGHPGIRDVAWLHRLAVAALDDVLAAALPAREKEAR